MKKILKWVGIALVGLMILGFIIDANKSPEQKAAEAAAHEQERIKHAEDEAKQAVIKQEQAIQDGIPKCDSTIAKDGLKNAFDQSQFARTLNLSMIEISAPQETAFDSKSKIRTCSGIITMNSAEKVDVEFKLEGRADGQYMLTFEVADHTKAPSPSTIAVQKVEPVIAPEQLALCQGLDLSVTPDQIECFDREFADTDKKLNVMYKQLMLKLDDSRKSFLKKEQVAWIKEKEAKCAQAGKEFEGGQMEVVAIADCTVQMTKQRLTYLNNYQ